MLTNILTHKIKFFEKNLKSKNKKKKYCLALGKLRPEVQEVFKTSLGYTETNKSLKNIKPKP